MEIIAIFLFAIALLVVINGGAVAQPLKLVCNILVGAGLILLVLLVAGIHIGR
jgi:hypothetical protein